MMHREMATRPSFVVVGSTMIDLIAYTPRVPGPGETLVGDRFDMGFGGKGANQAVMARLLGADVAMVNRLGDDSYGAMILENLASFGIDTTNMERVPGSSGVATIWVEPDGTNRIVIIPGANHALTPERAAAAIASIHRVDIVVGQFEIPQAVTAAAFAEARRRGAVTILNPAPAHEIEPALFAVTDWLIANEVEFRVLAGCSGDLEDDAAFATFAARTGPRLVVTLGGHGAALVSTAGTVVRVPATPVDAVDTTGAGDAFVGAFAFGLAAGLAEADAVRLACACASDSVTRPGTQGSFPSPEQTRALFAAVVG